MKEAEQAALLHVCSYTEGMRTHTQHTRMLTDAPLRKSSHLKTRLSNDEGKATTMFCQRRMPVSVHAYTS